MIKVVLDTNVFISGILTPKNPPAKILELISSGQLRLIASKSTIKETRKVLRYPKIVKILKKQGLSPEIAEEAFNNLIALAVVTPGTIKVEEIKSDPSDNIFLSAAIEGKVDFIVSGDAHLTDLNNYKGIQIVNPHDFLKIITDNSYI